MEMKNTHYKKQDYRDRCLKTICWKHLRPFLQNKDVLKKIYIPVRNFNKILFELEPSSSP